MVQQDGDRRARNRNRVQRTFGFLTLFFLALDVDLPSEQFCGQTHILSALADRQRQLRVIDDHFHLLIFDVHQIHAADLGRAQGVGGKRNRLFGIFNDVNLFAAQLADNGLHAHALHTHASAHRVHIAIAGLDGNLGSLAGFTGTGPDDDRAIVNLRHFLLKQTLHQARIGPGNQHARVLARLIDGLNHRAHAFTHRKALETRLLFLRNAGFRFAHIDHQIGAFDTLYDAVHQFPDPVGKFHINIFALGLAHFLQNHLFGHLGGNPSQRLGRLRNPDYRIDGGILVEFQALFQGHFVQRIFDGLHYLLHQENMDRAGLGVKFRFQIFVGLKVFLRRQHHGILHRIQDDLAVDALFFT